MKQTTTFDRILPAEGFEFFDILTHSEAETMALGRELAKRLKAGRVIALYGKLGSGKTCLTRGICAELDVRDSVSSPTFTLINEYLGDYRIYHCDFYRIEDENQLFGLGLDEYFESDGICIIEWPERARALLPDIRIEIYIETIFDLQSDQIRRFQIYGRNCKI